MNNEIEFNIKVTMNRRWVNDFCSMLKQMEYCGNIGHSSIIGFYSDGDGDFRPKFKIDQRYEEQKGFKELKNKPLPKMSILFDAG